MQYRIPITLSSQDRARLGVLASTRDVSLAEAARRAIVADFERIQDEDVRSRIEDPLLVRLESLASRLEELAPLIHGTGLRLLALTNVSKGRVEIEAEIERLVRPA